MHTSKLRTHMDTRGLGNIKAAIVEDDTIVNNVLSVEQFWIKPMQQAPYKEVTWLVIMVHTHNYLHIWLLHIP